VPGSASGEWLESPQGAFALVGQAISLAGIPGGAYVVAAKVSDTAPASCVEGIRVGAPELLEMTLSPDPARPGFAFAAGGSNHGFAAAGNEAMDPCGFITQQSDIERPAPSSAYASCNRRSIRSSTPSAGAKRVR
jgi:hypothetical protein